MEGQRKKLLQLVDQFNFNIQQYKSRAYDEVKAGVDFAGGFVEVLE